jgi:prepilin-type N-terminal cleavage/methylation domain-containing protein
MKKINRTNVLRKNALMGFTFIEVLVSLAIISIIVATSLTAFRNVYRASGTRIAALEITDALRTARSNTLAGKDASVYGVRVGTSSVTRFVGSIYSAGSASNTIYAFEAGAYATGSLVTSMTDIVFSRLTGLPSATGTILIIDIDKGSTTSIQIESTGLVE